MRIGVKCYQGVGLFPSLEGFFDLFSTAADALDCLFHSSAFDACFFRGVAHLVPLSSRDEFSIPAAAALLGSHAISFRAPDHHKNGKSFINHQSSPLNRFGVSTAVAKPE